MIADATRVSGCRALVCHHRRTRASTCGNTSRTIMSRTARQVAAAPTSPPGPSGASSGAWRGAIGTP